MEHTTIYNLYTFLKSPGAYYIGFTGDEVKSDCLISRYIRDLLPIFNAARTSTYQEHAIRLATDFNHMKSMGILY